MQSQEQQLIEGLFSRLQEAEKQSAPRDSEAEQAISAYVERQPAAPYYMAQVILIQEAALKRLEQRVRDLELQAERAQQSAPSPSSGGFLSGLFGGGARPEPAKERPYSAPSGGGWNEPGSRYAAPSVQPAPAPASSAPGFAQRGSGFLGGALQTAAGVAGGMVVGNLLSNLFHHSQPQEIVDVIQEAPAQAPDSSEQAPYALGGDDQYGADQAGYDEGGYADGGDFSDDSDWV